MKKIKFSVLTLMVMLLFVIAIPAGAVTDGELDGNGHPQVVLLVMDVQGSPAFRCSATMLTSNVVLTAGHCTNNHPDLDSAGNNVGDYTGMRIFTESDVDAGIANGTNNYPFCNAGDLNCVEAVSWSAHPLYETAPFFVHDVGIVILAGAGYDPGVFGTLPGVDSLDVLATQRGKQNVSFTAVGYGLQQITSNPLFTVSIQADRVRMFSNPHLIQINSPGFTGDFSLLLSNNHSTGGTCFGDSGGPNFLGDSNVVAGVTSFGLNGNCAGTGGVFRMDRQNVLDFVNAYLP